MFKKIASILVLTIFLTSCATSTEKQFQEMPPLEFEKTEAYTLDTTGLEFPDEPNLIYGKYDEYSDSLKIVSEADDPTHVIFTAQDALKVGQTISLAATYKDLSKEHVELLNIYISTNNALKELVSIEREKARIYRELFISADEAYDKERKSRRIDKIFHKGEILLLSLGFAFAL